jgi:hypothetical protein
VAALCAVPHVGDDRPKGVLPRLLHVAELLPLGDQCIINIGVEVVTDEISKALFGQQVLTGF